MAKISERRAPRAYQFTHEQRKELEQLGLFPEQINHLDRYLQSIGWRRAPGPRMQDVRRQLKGMANALKRVEQLYLSMSQSKDLACQEVASRFYVAQIEKKVGEDALHDSLEQATDIVNHALETLPSTPRSTRLHSDWFVELILKALRLGHVERFRCSGYGETPPEPEPMPPFLINETRTMKASTGRGRVFPFGEVVRIVAEASGGWSADDAIRNYRKRGKPPVDLYNRKRHSLAPSKRGVVTETLLERVRKQAPKT